MTVKIISYKDSGKGDGSVDVVLERNGQKVTGIDIAWLDYETDDELSDIFDEWVQNAEDGEDGFTVEIL